MVSKRSAERPGFVNREAELVELRRLVSRGRPALALLYGRRRVGKTFLLDHAWQDGRFFYFLAGDTTGELNKRDLLQEIAAFLPEQDEADPALYPTWRHIFRLFADLASDGPFVVVLDEFQHLLGKDEDIASQLMAVWDRELKGRPLILVACGSEVSTMQNLQSGAGPLYGRWDWAARLRPFDYLNSALMTPGRSLREKALIYGIFGGTPRYLASIQPGESLSQRVTDSILSPRGEIHIQLERIIEQEKGIRDPAEYRAVLTAVANGASLLNEIANSAGLQDRPHVVRRALEVLEDLELIWRERNFESGTRTPYRYRILDNAVSFWYRFVYPHRSRLETGDVHEVWKRYVEGYLDDYMGKIFEGICREAFGSEHVRRGVPGAREVARWEGKDKNRRDIEIDFVARLDDERVLTGEVKWSSKPVGQHLHWQLRRDLEDLARSGSGWAADALDVEKSAGHIFFSAAGFESGFEALAEQDPSIRLVDLEDIYARE
ncbi:MAG TPA: ATP-binding protein [Trueperaceae bacterium]